MVELAFAVVVVVLWLSKVTSHWLQWVTGLPDRFVLPVVCNCLIVSSIHLLLCSDVFYIEGTHYVAIVFVAIVCQVFSV